jgi:hypothetical protein
MNHFEIGGLGLRRSPSLPKHTPHRFDIGIPQMAIGRIPNTTLTARPTRLDTAITN